MYIGLTIEQYNYCTPYELNIMMKQYNKREEDNIEKIRVQAWLIAKLTVPNVKNYESTFKKKADNNLEHEGLEKNKMHDLQIKRHLEQFLKGGLMNGKSRNGKYRCSC